MKSCGVFIEIKLLILSPFISNYHPFKLQRNRPICKYFMIFFKQHNERSTDYRQVWALSYAMTAVKHYSFFKILLNCKVSILCKKSVLEVILKCKTCNFPTQGLIMPCGILIIYNTTTDMLTFILPKINTFTIANCCFQLALKKFFM